MAWNYSCLHVLGNTVINGSETGIFIHNAGRLILGNAAISDCISGIDIYPQGHVTTCFFGTVDCNITECDQGISVSELSTLNMMHGGSDIDISGNGVGIRIWPGGRAVLDPAWITGNTTNLINDGEIF
jgi:hypothetical protein